MRGGDVGARRSLSAEMDVDVAYSAAAGDGGDLELKRFTMEFLSHYCSAIPSVMDDAGKGEPDKKQKRSASKSFLVPCGNGSVKKQCVARCGGLEALKVEELGDNVPLKKQCVTDYGGSETLEELGEGAKVSSEGFFGTLVVAYGISINLVEVTWKSRLKAQYPSPAVGSNS